MTVGRREDAESADTRWIVLLEVAEEHGETSLDVATLQRLISAMADVEPVSLYSPHRYALQICVAAPTPPAALATALGRWQAALRQLGIPAWDLVRGEVMTPEELERELESRDDSPSGPDMRRVATGGLVDPESDELLRRALYDSLTGLPTGGLFHDQIRRVLGESAANPGVHAVMLLDLDGFTAVNTRLGPEVGDQLLSTVAERLAEAVRNVDAVARLGDDEFAVFVTLPSQVAVGRLAQRILEATRLRFVVEEQAVEITASIGVATGWAGTDPDALIEQAARALKSAQRAGRDRYEFFSSGYMSEPATAGRRVHQVPDPAGYLALLERIATRVRTCSAFDEAADRALEELCAYGGWTAARVNMVGPDGAGLVTVSVRSCTIGREPPSPPNPAGEGDVPEAPETLARRVLADGQPVWVSNPPEHTVPAMSQGSAGFRSAVAFPVPNDDQVGAVLELFGPEPAAPDQHLLPLLASVGIQLGWVLERERANALRAMVSG